MIKLLQSLLEIITTALDYVIKAIKYIYYFIVHIGDIFSMFVSMVLSLVNFKQYLPTPIQAFANILIDVGITSLVLLAIYKIIKVLRG